MHLLAPPPPDDGAPAPARRRKPVRLSDADRVVEQYRKIGEAEKHVYGERGAGAPNYNVDRSKPPDARNRFPEFASPIQAGSEAPARPPNPPNP